MKTKLIAVPIPVKYKWKAQDANGEWYGYVRKPNPEGDYWNNNGAFIYLVETDPNPNWLDTLERIVEIEYV